MAFPASAAQGVAQELLAGTFYDLTGIVRSNPKRTAVHGDVVANTKALGKALATARKQAQALDLDLYLDEVEASFRTLEVSLTTIMPPEAYNAVCPSHARHLPQKVFDIPELFEAILEKLDMRNLLRVMGINRQWLGAIQDSVTLRRKLSLEKESLTGCFSAPLMWDFFPGLRVMCSFMKEPDFIPAFVSQRLQDNEVRITAEFEQLRQTTYYADLPRAPHSIGPRCRKMLVCQQPPVTSMAVDLKCCGPSSMYLRRGPFTGHRRPAFTQTISNSNGLTIGDLFDAHKSLVAEHENCPYANEYLLEPITKKFQPSPSFSAKIIFDQLDPQLEQTRHQSIARLDVLESEANNRQQMRAFTTARHHAHTNSQPVPTFEEWEASQA